MIPSRSARTFIGEPQYNRMAMSDITQDGRYAKIFLKTVGVCRNYRPKFGEGGDTGLTLEEFRKLYGRDPFYSWLGLDSPLVYSAHKAAGGMTSVYRQIGMGCQRIFTQILIDQLGLSEDEANWSYEVQRAGGKKGRLSLDGRIPLQSVRDASKVSAVKSWIGDCARRIAVEESVISVLKGAVFEVRQGYKSKDSKRQNADLANAATAYTQGLLPVVILLSTQIDRDIVERYTQAKWVILSGTIDGDATTSSYAFVKSVLGYDLAAFFERHSEEFKSELESIFRLLLSP
jgi:hypothetical protein